MDDQEVVGKIYRFIGFYNSSKTEEAKNIILSSKIRSVAPFRFNDPFDCYPHFDFSNDIDEQRKALISISAEVYPGRTEQDRSILVEQELADPSRQEGLREIVKNKLIPNIREQSGVICFTGNKEDIRMWSLYADSHRGICLEFDRTRSDTIFNQAERVKYSEEYPIITPLDVGSGYKIIAEKTFLTKAETWEYEGEWRIVGYRQGEKEYSFDRELLTGVFLGCDIAEDYEKMVKDWVSISGRNLDCYRARLKEAKYGLDFIKIWV